MEPSALNKMNERNNKLIELVIQKINASCPDSVDLIGIAGSFATGDVYEGSDLDLLIISNDKQATTLNTCFILNDIAYDFYCSPWDRLEKMSNYDNPHITKLFNLDIVYQRDDACLNKYLKLRKLCESRLIDIKANTEKAKNYFDKALISFAQLILSDDLYSCREMVFEMSTNIEFSIYLLNNTYIKKGIRRVPEEMEKMTKIPNGFIPIYKSLFETNDINAIKKSSTEVVRLLGGYIKNTRKNKSLKINSDALTGTYEEIFSNWKNKMILAAKSGDTYLSFVTMSSCQKFYDEMAQKYDIPHIKIIQSFDPNNLLQTMSAFDKGMSDWKKLYTELKKPIKEYNTIEEFAKDYLNQI